MNRARDQATRRAFPPKSDKIVQIAIDGEKIGDACGEIDSMSLLAGQGVGLIREVKPAVQIVHELVEEAR
jgi:hypothetical protein